MSVGHRGGRGARGGSLRVQQNPSEGGWSPSVSSPPPSTRSTRSTRSVEPNPERSRDSGGTAGEGLPRAWRAKPCVCALSGQLARDRARLLKAEKLVSRGIHRLVSREDALGDLDAQVSAQEADLAEKRRQHRCSEAAAEANLEASRAAAEQSDQRRSALEGREAELQALRDRLAERRGRLEARAEAAAAKRRQLSEDQATLRGLRAEAEQLAEAAARELATAEERERKLAASGDDLSRARAGVADLRASVRVRQDALEPVREELQTKEADLHERRALLERGRAQLVEREARLEQVTGELASSQAAEEDARREWEEMERRLSLLWDDIHQRQQVLDDIGTSLHSREERLSSAQHSMVCASEASVSNLATFLPSRDTEQLRLELAAAELADRAWRERSAALVDREEELLARLHFLEAEG